MKNINFGNYLYELRKQNKLTQRFVAYQLGVSDKAVSKWETGKSVHISVSSDSDGTSDSLYI